MDHRDFVLKSGGKANSVAIINSARLLHFYIFKILKCLWHWKKWWQHSPDIKKWDDTYTLLSSPWKMMRKGSRLWPTDTGTDATSIDARNPSFNISKQQYLVLWYLREPISRSDLMRQSIVQASKRPIASIMRLTHRVLSQLTSSN